MFSAVVFLSALIITPQDGYCQQTVPQSVFTIGNINPIFNFPINIYSSDGATLSWTDTWRYPQVGIGAVGLAVDEDHESLFITYEAEGFVDIVSARDGANIDRVTLAGTSNLAGIDVREGDNLLYVVDRGMNTLYSYDTINFVSAGSWILVNLGGDGAYDIVVVENDSGPDYLYVTNATTDVGIYNLDTQAREGALEFPDVVNSVAVDNSSGTPVLFGAAAISGTPGGHNLLMKYDVATHTTDQIDLGADGRGVGVNPADGVVYVNVGGVPNTLRVYNEETLTELNRYNLPGSPTDLEVAQISIGSFMKKEIVSTSANPANGAGEFEEGENITFEITVINRRAADIDFLPVADQYDTQILNYASASITPSDNIDDGEIEFTDLINAVGHNLAFGEEFSFEITFKAEPASCVDPVEGQNTAVMSGATDTNSNEISEQTAGVGFTVHCGCWRTEDCDDGLFCNGQEDCFSRQCSSGANPCDEDEICNETTDSCDFADDDVNDDADDDVDDDVNDDFDDDFDDDANDDSDDDNANDDADDDDDDGGDEDDDLFADDDESDSSDDSDDSGGSCCGC